MKTLRTIFLLILTAMCFTQVANAEVLENTDIQYAYTPENSLMFEVSKKHARQIIEPQVEFHWTLDKHKNTEVKERLTQYVHEHTEHMLDIGYGIKSERLEMGKTYIGTPNGLPDGMIFVTDVKIRKGWRYQNVRVGFIIPDISGFTAEDVVYFVYNT